jgi:hypothetical protein
MQQRMDASSTGLNEILDEVRAQSQAIFVLIDRCHRREICQRKFLSVLFGLETRRCATAKKPSIAIPRPLNG